MRIINRINFFLFILNVYVLTVCNTPQKTVFLFSHGIADTYKQAFIYKEAHFFCGALMTFNYPDATESIMSVNYKETSFGQSNEISRLKRAYQNITHYVGKDCHPNIVLFGLSRGASNICIFAGQNNNLDNVKAIILESPYYSMSEVIASIMQKKGFDLLPLSYGESIAEFIFKKYSRNGTTPGNTIQNVSHTIPILIVCSKEDQLVPYTTSIKLYNQLIASGHPKTHLLILNHGRHAKILSGQDQYLYQSVVHAFYKKYNLPHNTLMALDGEHYLSQNHIIDDNQS